jgi:hypothetical protein
MRQVGTSNVLPIDEKGVQEELDVFNTVMEQQTDSDEPDFNAVTQAATQSAFKIKQLAAKKKAWDPIRPNAVKYGFTAEEVAAIDSETDPAKLQAILNENGSGLVNYDPTTNAMSFTPVSDFKPIGESLGEFFTNYSGQIFNTPQKGMQTKIDKTNILYYGVDPNTKSIFVNENLNTPSANVNFETALRRSGQAIPKTGDEYLIKQAEFLGNAFEEDAKNRYKREKIGSGGGFTINIGDGKETAPGTAFIGDQDINYGPSNLGLSVRTKASYTVANASSISGIPTNIKNLNTGEYLSGETAATFNTATVYVAPVFNSDYTVEYKGQKIPFKKGEVVPRQIENTVKKDGKLVYDKVGWGTVNIAGGAQGVPVQIPQSQTFNSMYNTLDKAEKAQLEEEVNRLNAQIGRLNKPAAPTQQKQGGTGKGTFPSAAEWYKKNPNKNLTDYLKAKREAGF